MKVTPCRHPEVLLIEPRVFGDERGWFCEAWHQERYAAFGIGPTFVQDNQSWSRRGALRGLHIQEPFGQGKLAQVLAGEVFDVAVDVRLGSPHFGRWAGAVLSAENKRQLWIPEGFLHGYLVTSPEALFAYKCTEQYHPETQFEVRWDDPGLGIEWPAGITPILSPKDRDAPRLRDIPEARLPRWRPERL